MNNKVNRNGFIKIGSIILLVLIFIALRLIWGIDISEPAEELFRKANTFTLKMINTVCDGVSAFLNRIGNR